jgi:transposase
MTQSFRSILGIDAAKAKLVCCLLFADGKKRNKAIDNKPTGFAALSAWIGKQGAALDETLAVIEATGVYHEQAALALSQAGLAVAIANPKRARQFASGIGILSKNDPLDSYVLARYGQTAGLRLWQPPAPECQLLAKLLARRDALQKELQRERNRKEKALCEAQPSGIILSSLESSIAFLKQQAKALDKEIDGHLKRHPDLLAEQALLRTIPSIGPQAGNHLLASLHAHGFQCAGQFVSYLGLDPCQRQSGTSVHGQTRMSKQGPGKLRALLYMSAIVAIVRNPVLRAFYLHLLDNGKKKMAAIGAVMRKLACLVFAVFKNKTPWNPVFVPQGA